MRRLRRPWVLGPRMARVTRAQRLPHFLVRAVPEAREIARDLHRPSVRREQLERDRHLARTDARRGDEAEELLEFDGGEDAAVVAILESRSASARQRDRERREAIEILLRSRERDATPQHRIYFAIRVQEPLRFDGIDFRWSFEQRNRAVPRALDRLHATGHVRVHTIEMRGCEPVAIDVARHPDRLPLVVRTTESRRTTRARSPSRDRTRTCAHDRNAWV